MERTFYVIQSEHNFDYYTKYEFPGQGPRWSTDAHAKEFPSKDHAYTAIGNMHPRQRDIHKPIVLEAFWTDIGGPDRFGPILAVARVF